MSRRRLCTEFSPTAATHGAQFVHDPRGLPTQLLDNVSPVTNQTIRTWAVPLILALALGACDEETPVTPALDPTGPVSVRTYEQGTRLFVETRQGNTVARIGADRTWGGAIFEAELNGVNMVNVYDPMGREIQVSLYDGSHSYDNCAGCRMWGWNPVQGGDRDGNNGLVTAGWVDEGGFFIRARPNHWHPVALGGTYGTPVRSDIIVEERISAVPEHPLTFRVEYRVIHEGDDTHAPSFLQEFPAVYVNREFPRFIHYSGTRPWTGEAAVESPLPLLNTRHVKRVYTPEWWASFVNREGIGLTIFTPGAFPYTVPGYFPGPTVGPHAGSTGYTYSFNPFGLAPRQEIVGEVYLILGDYREARKVIYKLQKTIDVLDISVPVGAVEASGPSPAGAVRLTGWAYDNVGVARVEIYLDGKRVGTATTGQLRPEIRDVWQGAPANTGFSFLLNAGIAAPGDHEMVARAIDPSGNSAEWKTTVRIPG